MSLTTVVPRREDVDHVPEADQIEALSEKFLVLQQAGAQVNAIQRTPLRPRATCWARRPTTSNPRSCRLGKRAAGAADIEHSFGGLRRMP